MSTIVQYVISTKADENSDAHNTTVLVDFDGYTLEHAKDAFFASTSPRVAVQSQLRRIANKKGGSIPAKIEIKALDFATKANAITRVPTPDEVAARAAVDPAYRAEVLAKMKALEL